MKTILMLLLFGSFMFTGNLWTALAVILLGMIPDDKPAPKPSTAAPDKPGFIMRWLDAQGVRKDKELNAHYEAQVREIRKKYPSLEYVGPQEVPDYQDRQSRIWGIKIW